MVESCGGLCESECFTGVRGENLCCCPLGLKPKMEGKWQSSGLWNPGCRHLEKCRVWYERKADLRTAEINFLAVACGI